jgi:hypothetical protein
VTADHFPDDLAEEDRRVSLYLARGHKDALLLSLIQGLQQPSRLKAVVLGNGPAEGLDDGFVLLCGKPLKQRP